jgi:hypothetical protein
MSDRPTPETDQEEQIDNGDTVPLFEFCRKLERQRDESRELAQELRDALEAVMPYIVGDRIVPWKAAETSLTRAKEVLP